ncbi:MAG: hypothetical protein KatS3mg102_0149 [Planctomycetota bacterium]|nr:MAG: hypothetical protein KatS3mg102_0149 [Planctomycetota bacterium]
MSVDPLERAERQALKTREAIQRNGPVFLPLVRAIVDTVREGGRLLLVGEGRLQLLADHAATDVVGRRHHDGSQLPAAVLSPLPEGPQAAARCIGPFDALIAIADTCEEPYFAGVLEAARKRGAKVLCLCIGRARLEGRADVAIDIPEPRPHRVAGLLASVLHYVCKLALRELRAHPLVRARRLDQGPRRPAAANGSPGLAAGHRPAAGAASSPPVGAAAGAGAAGSGSAASGESGSGLEIGFALPGLDPEDEAAAAVAAVAAAVLDEDDSVAGAGAAALAAGGGEAEAEGEEEFIKLEESGSYDGVVLREAQRIVTFRCKRCREPLLAGPELAGRRARCPFCDRRVKVPRSAGHPYVAAEPLLAQSGRTVSSRFRPEEARLVLLMPERAPCEARLLEVTAEGIEASVSEAEAAGLVAGSVLRARLEAPAFLEPLFVDLQVEHRVGGEHEAQERGRVRLVLPLVEGAPRAQRQRLERLAALARARQ